MLKTKAWRIAVWGCGLGILVGLLVVAWELDFHGQICKYNQTINHEDCTTYSIFSFLFIEVGQTLNDYGVAISALATVIIAAFTFTLWVATNGQARLTKIAAYAARDATEALPVVERAYVYPEIVSAEDIAECIRHARVFYFDEFAADGSPNADRPAAEIAKLSFRLRNYGKTPAILKSLFAGLGAYPLGAEIGLSIPEGILGEKESTSDLIAEMQVGLTTPTKESVMNAESDFNKYRPNLTEVTVIEAAQAYGRGDEILSPMEKEQR